MPEEFRHLFEEGATNEAFPSMAVGLIDGKEVQTWAFGRASTSSPSSDAYEIGAVTDVFTGLLVAQALLEGRLRLNESLRDALPGGLRWADDALAETTIASLVTQQSRLPATPANLFPPREQDPYAAYAEGDLLGLLANYSIGPAPQDYSALNAAVLALALQRAYGVDYAHALSTKILQPLGLANTGFGDAPALLPGHAFGAEAPHWHYAALASAAGLRSTLDDLLTLVRAVLDPENSPLRAALLLSRQSRGNVPGDGIGFGWNVHEIEVDGQTWPLVWRASETGGFSAFVGLRTDQQRGLVLLANNAVDLAPIGIAWLSGTAAPGAPAKPFVADPTQFEKYSGLYRLLTGIDATIRTDNDALSMQLPGEPPWPLHAVGEDAFVHANGAIGVTFVRNIDHISGLMLRTNDAFVSAQRLSGRAPRLQPVTHDPDPKTVSALAGDYVLDAGVMLRIAALPDGLSAQLTGSVAIPMRAAGLERFVDAEGANSLVFHRDDRGVVDRVVLDLAGSERKAMPAHWRAPFAPQMEEHK